MPLSPVMSTVEPGLCATFARERLHLLHRLGVADHRVEAERPGEILLEPPELAV